MDDPLPENIDGSKRVSHEVQHTINWGHVALGLGVGAAAFVAYRVLAGGEQGRGEQQSIVLEDTGDPQLQDGPAWSVREEEHTAG